MVWPKFDESEKTLLSEVIWVKTMPVAFFDSRGLIHKEFVSPDKTIYAEYYKGVMDRLLKQIATFV